MNDTFESKTAVMDRQTPPRRRAGLAPPLFLASVRGRIVFGFALLVVILVAVVTGSAWLQRQHERQLGDMERRAATVSLLRDAEKDGAIAFATVQAYVLSGNETLLPDIRANRDASFAAAADAVAREDARGHEEPAAAINQLLAEPASLSEGWDGSIALRKAGDTQGAVAAITSTMPALRQLGERVDEIIAAENQEVAALRARADTTGRLAFWLLVVSGAAGVVLGVAASLFIARSILRPLSRLESAALAVAGGDLKARARPGGPRELASPGATLNRMTEALLDASKRRQLEAALQRSEQHFRSLIENSLDIIIGTGPDGAMRYLSPSVRRTLGYDPEELVGKNPSDLVHPDDLPAVMAAVAENLRSTEPGPLMEIRLRHRNGSWRAVEAIGRGFLDDSGAVGIVVNARDITQRKQAEEALKEAEAKYRTLVEQLPAITYIDVVDEASPAGFTPVYFSPQIETMLGYSPEEFNARAELWSEVLHPEDRERAPATDAHHYAAGEPSSHEYRLIARDGRAVR